MMLGETMPLTTAGGLLTTLKNEEAVAGVPPRPCCGFAVLGLTFGSITIAAWGARLRLLTVAVNAPPMTTSELAVMLRLLMVELAPKLMRPPLPTTVTCGALALMFRVPPVAMKV